MGDDLIRTRAQALRKNATKEENHLWYDFLRRKTPQWKRQVPMGRYIADFYCPGAKLIVELDGGQHYEENGLEYDAERTDYLERRGFRVLRFTNLEIKKNFPGVCFAIQQAVRETPPHQPRCARQLPPEGEA